MEPTAQSLWDAAIESLRPLLNQEVFRLWFAPIRPVELQGDRLTLAVANEFCGVWLGENYRDVIDNALKIAAGRAISFSFVAAEISRPAPDSEGPGKLATPARDPKATIIEEIFESTNAIPNFDPKNTFDSFVVGNNTFAHAAATAVAQNPGRSYNPLFLIGGVGLGKTHLLHAIGQFVSAHRRTARVAYVSTERFTNEFIDALQNSRLMRFRKKFRETDVLLIDDIQFLSGKERIQEEFFHTFNALHEARKQIVLTCDRAASEIQGLEQRLVSRFEWGLVADLQPPDVETRVAILRKKADQMGYVIPADIAQFLAERIRTNVRRLEGALTRVASYSRLTGHPITLERLRDLLRDVLSEEGRATLTIEVIIKRVADHYDLRVADILGRRRPDHIAFPRQVAMFLARTLTESSLSTIGDAFGGRDHGTVLHACRAVADRMETDTTVRKAVSHLDRDLRG
ncbi:MAG: chromosomal replication initiator protein DnaA [Verrucomicrobiales bacterium]|nr:chromosomal replication initiator protein DnaA [Verrucomicrobiales bacterium]